MKSKKKTKWLKKKTKGQTWGRDGGGASARGRRGRDGKREGVALMGASSGLFRGWGGCVKVGNLCFGRGHLSLFTKFTNVK